ncbi:NKG2-A/NKG2-B type II integral membrane protein-like [Orycteropus afer afer]|uniref:NKG2-A/NKG2-B type II integral membrane protein-like n=1 Tax=Orycteropus afer afer TaxID=1230840 RepID=A0AC54Z996_ORYAF|nr:NKG2-A/NKG2-B type II integral membrane protein-like [Orycteropus afer afer]
MNDQIVMYSDLPHAQKSKRSQIKPKDTNSSISISEQELTYVELNLHNAPQHLQNSDKNFHCKGKLIAGILGIICLVLMASVIIVKVTVTTSSVQTLEQNNSQITSTQKVYHCGPCPEGWFSYSHNCYSISDERKSWNESQKACVSMVSNLLYIDNEEEMKLMMSLSFVSWIGLSRKSSDYPWLWIDGSIFICLEIEPSNAAYNCAMLVEHGPQSDNCETSKKYICKHGF